MGMIVERTPSTQVPDDLRNTLGHFAAEQPILTFSNHHNLVSRLLWCKALRHYLTIRYVLYAHFCTYRQNLPANESVYASYFCIEVPLELAASFIYF